MKDLIFKPLPFEWKVDIPREIAIALKDASQSNELAGTGADINAWKRLEQLYGQNQSYSFFKAVKNLTYDKLQEIGDGADGQIDMLQALHDANGLSCHCTD